RVSARLSLGGWQGVQRALPALRGGGEFQNRGWGSCVAVLPGVVSLVNHLARIHALQSVGSAPRTRFSRSRYSVRGADPTRIAQGHSGGTGGSPVVRKTRAGRPCHLLQFTIGDMIFVQSA